MLILPGQAEPRLAVLSLGVVGDQRAIPELQPPLVEGIHLRWAFLSSLGFPWYGFYLLRRLTPSNGAAVCASSQFGGLVPGPLGATELSIPLGKFSSDQPLALTDDFPASGTVELDLSGRGYLAFRGNAAVPSRLFRVALGFVEDFPPRDGSNDQGDDDTSGGGSDGLGGDPDTTDDCSGEGTDGTDGTHDDRGDLGGTGSGGCGCACGTSGEVRPILERVVPLGDGRYLAVFGYSSSSTGMVSIPAGPENSLYPEPADRGQPTSFLPGCHHDVFTVIFDGRPIVWSVGGVTQSASVADAVRATSSDGILVTAHRAGMRVAEYLFVGRKGEVVTMEVAFEAIDEIRISSGPARLVDLCSVPWNASLTTGWAPVPDFPQPFSLPVYHPEYPCNPSAIDEPAARALAFARILYGDSTPWQGDPIHDLHDSLLKIIAGGPSKGVTDFFEDVEAAVDPASPETTTPVWKDQSTLNLLLAASVHPAIAQMLGLYWVDKTAVEGVLYDYMLVADYENAGGLDINAIVALVNAGDFSNVEAYYKSGARRAVPMPLSAPQNLRSYALPLTAVPTDLPGDVAGLVGLRWDVPVEGITERLPTDAAFLYHLWRHDFGRSTPPNPVLEGGWNLLSVEGPLAPGTNRTEPPPAIAEWPAAGVFATDGPLFEGWYAYAANGIDIFGRFSARSSSANWVDAADDHVRDFNAVHLIDTTPPPAPLALVGSALDPADPFVIKDAAYTAWRNAPGNATTIGLRVTWSWTGQQMRRAPDTREFRIYVNTGTSLPTASDPSQWQQRIAVVRVDENIRSEVFVPLRADLVGVSATAAGSVVTLADGGALDGALVYGVELELGAALGQKRFFVRSIDPVTRQVTIDGVPVIGGAGAWKLGIRERTYDVLLPGAPLAVTPAFALPGAPSLTTPVAYNLVGVTAADDKNNEIAVVDKVSSGPLSGRFGNEGPVAGPATIYRVWRELPPKATLPAFPGERLYATRADFHSKSYFAFHFSTPDNLSVHVYRALDAALFLQDAKKGFAPNRRSSDVADAPVYPPEWTTPRRQAAIAQLNALGSATGYASLGDDALRVLASYASNATAFACLTETPLVAAGDSRGPSDPTNYAPIDHVGLHVDTLDGRAQSRYFYRAAYVDAAANAGALGLSTPPVYLPASHLPRSVGIGRAWGAEGHIVVEWPDISEGGIESYRLFRTSDPKAVGNVRHMREVLPALEAGSSTNGTLQVLDYDVTALREYFYRLVAVSSAGLESEPSTVVAARAIKTVPSAAPVLDSIVKLNDPALAYRVTWSAGDEVSVLVQRHAPGDSTWRTLSGWLEADMTAYVDSTVEDGAIYEYRLRGRDASGIQTGLSNSLTNQGL